MDSHTTLAELREIMRAFVAARNWEQYHTPKNLAMAIGIEAAELMEHFQWLTVEESWQLIQDPNQRAEVADELADVIIYCLSFANQADIDMSDAVLAKMRRNEHRFPPHTKG
jgi:NTP pyrophosphatase (non-canonical NTP hydrolase)